MRHERDQIIADRSLLLQYSVHRIAGRRQEAGLVDAVQRQVLLAEMLFSALCYLLHASAKVELHTEGCQLRTVHRTAQAQRARQHPTRRLGIATTRRPSLASTPLHERHTEGVHRQVVVVGEAGVPAPNFRPNVVRRGRYAPRIAASTGPLHTIGRGLMDYYRTQRASAYNGQQ
jgi:hypothetical protein